MVDYAAGGCKLCHGNDRNAAPPLDTRGNADFSAIGVGAHQVHLSGGANGRPLACKRVPSRTRACRGSDARGRPSGGGRAERRGERARSLRPCGTSRARPAARPTAIHLQPVRRANRPCGTRKNPSAAAPATACSAAAASASGQLRVLPWSRRRFGQSQHHRQGSARERRRQRVAGRAAARTATGGTTPRLPSTPPAIRRPPSLASERIRRTCAARSARARCPAANVTSYLKKSWIRATSIRRLPAELSFSGVALAHGATPEFVNGSCQATSCHGAVVPGRRPFGAARNTTPTWTRVDGSQAACGSCHGIPPPPAASESRKPVPRLPREYGRGRPDLHAPRAARGRDRHLPARVIRTASARATW